MTSEITLGDRTRLLQAKTDERGRVTLGSEYADEELRLLIEDTRDIEDLDVYFHRLGLGLTPREILRIFMERRMAIDWNVGGMRNPHIYEKVIEYRQEETEKSGRGVRSDAKHLIKISRKGGLVAVYCPEKILRYHPMSKWDLHEDVILLGEVESGTEIEPREYQDKNGDQKYLNTLQMKDTIEVYKSQDTGLFGNYPRGTIRNWNDKADTVRNVYQEELQNIEEFYK